MRTDEEITTAVQSIFSRRHDIHEVDVEIRRDGESIYVKVTQMYDAPEHGLGLVEFVHRMTEAVGLPEMEEADSVSEKGCETCDHGSCYGTEFRFWRPTA